MNFLLLAAGRSGSTLLVNYLSSHPEVRCHHEPFNQNGWHKELRNYHTPLEALDNLDTNGLSIPVHKKLTSLAQQTLGIHRGRLIIDPFKRQTSVKAEGFKITWAQANSMYKDLGHWLSQKQDVRCIFLYRYDYLARFVSYQLAQVNGLWNSSHKQHDAEPFEVSKIAFASFCQREGNVERKLLEMLTETNTLISFLSYEDMVEKPLPTVNSAFKSLGCEPLEKLETVTTKLVDTPMEELVINFRDLEVEPTNKAAQDKRSEWIERIS